MQANPLRKWQAAGSRVSASIALVCLGQAIEKARRRGGTGTKSSWIVWKPDNPVKQVFRPAQEGRARL